MVNQWLVQSHVILFITLHMCSPQAVCQENSGRLFGKVSRRTADVHIGKGFPASPFPAIACPSQYLERA